MHAKVIFIGKTGCGKTTLCQKLHQLEIKYKKTQSIEVYDHAIDTPGEYLENRRLYNALTVTSVDADIIALVADPTAQECYIPPGFNAMFGKPVIGIITKLKKVKDNKKIIELEKRLEMAGASPIFKIDTLADVGTQELFKYLEKQC